MRILLFLLSFLVLFPAVSIAQEEQTTKKRYYNSPNTSGGGGIYVSPTTSTSARNRAPIPLNQILRGKSSTVSYRPSTSFYGGANARPYGSGNDFSLALTPQDVRAREAARAKEVKAMERRNAREAAKRGTLADQDAAYLASFSAVPEEEEAKKRRASSSQPIKVYRKKSDLEKPKRIFNSVY